MHNIRIAVLFKIVHTVQKMVYSYYELFFCMNEFLLKWNSDDSQSEADLRIHNIIITYFSGSISKWKGFFCMNDVRYWGYLTKEI